MKLTKTDQPGFKIDRETNMVINTNTKDLTSYRRSIAEFESRKKLENEVESLNARLREIERLLLAHER